MKKTLSIIVTTLLMAGLFSCGGGGKVSETTTAEDGLVITERAIKEANRCLETSPTYNSSMARAFQSFQEKLALVESFPAATMGESHRYEKIGARCFADDLSCRYFYRSYTNTGTITNGEQGILSSQNLHERLQEIVQNARPDSTNNTYCALENIHYIKDTDNITYGISFAVPLFANPVVKIDTSNNRETGYRLVAKETESD